VVLDLRIPLYNLQRVEGGMKRLYNILFGIFFWLTAPSNFLKMWRRGNWRHGFEQRFGKYNTRLKHALTNRHVIWIHAVSVGEVNICTHLIEAIQQRLPNLKIVVSTTTSTGMELIRRKLPSHIEKIYYPIDLRRIVGRALTTIHPEAMVLVEAEIWPNLIWRLRKRRIPLFLVNARLSERSFRGYRRFGFLFRPLFASFDGVGAQTEEDSKRLEELGCKPQVVHVVGSIKFDATQLSERQVVDVQGILKRLKVHRHAQIIIGGSTHAGEEEILADIYQRLKKRFPRLFLIIAPRHFERGKSVGRALESKGINFVYRTQTLSNSADAMPNPVECLLLNTTGELRAFYECAAIIFVGKSLSAKGGQNPIEPAALGKAMVFGPHMDNFTTIAGQFVAQKGALQVKDSAGLEEAFIQLLEDKQQRNKLGKNALKVVKANQGALERTLDFIIPHIKTDEMYIKPSALANSPAKKRKQINKGDTPSS
jgi:3-deoxy-D-manno-octulosonic-acid transferase